jgi:hypothetical protein
MRDSISLFNNDIDDFSQFLDALRHHTSFKNVEIIRTLHMYNNRFLSEQMKLLADALKQNTSVTDFHFCDNPLGVQGAQYFAETFEKNTTLQSVSFYDNQIGNLGAVFLAKAVNHHINTLYLSKNGIDNMDALARMLLTNTTLTKLSLIQNKIKDQGAQSLAQGLQNNTTLKILNLGHNEIKDQGALALARALRKNTMLKELVLCVNQIGDRGGKAFQKVTHLSILNLSSNQIRNVDGWKMPFQVFDLFNNPIWDVEKLVQSLCKNFILENFHVEKDDHRITEYCERNRRVNLQRIKLQIFYYYMLMEQLNVPSVGFLKQVFHSVFLQM